MTQTVPDRDGPVPDRHASRFDWERALLADPGMPGHLLRTALALATYMTARTGADARPGVDRLRSDTRSSRATVLAHLAELRRRGWLEVQRGPGRGRPTTWQATIPNLCVTRGITSDGLDPFRGRGVRPTGPFPPDAPITGTYQPTNQAAGYAQGELPMPVAVRPEADRVIDRLPADLRPTGRARRSLRDRIAGLLAEGWTARHLADVLAADVPRPVRNPAGLLAWRLDALPAASPPRARAAARERDAADRARELLLVHGDPCPHGTPGGLEVLTSAGSPICPACRTEGVPLPATGEVT